MRYNRTYRQAEISYYLDATRYDARNKRCKLRRDLKRKAARLARREAQQVISEELAHAERWIDSVAECDAEGYYF